MVLSETVQFRAVGINSYKILAQKKMLTDLEGSESTHYRCPRIENWHHYMSTCNSFCK